MSWRLFEGSFKEAGAVIGPTSFGFHFYRIPALCSLMTMLLKTIISFIFFLFFS
jgi:hypothetical protein